MYLNLYDLNNSQFNTVKILLEDLRKGLETKKKKLKESGYTNPTTIAEIDSLVNSITTELNEINKKIKEMAKAAVSEVKSRNS